MNYPHLLDKVQVIDKTSVHYLETGRVSNSVMNYYRIVALDCGCVGKFFLCDIACQGYGDKEGRYLYTTGLPFKTCEKHQQPANE
jgi:hypothetical protein